MENRPANYLPLLLDAWRRIRELHDAIADTERDLTAYRELACAAIEALVEVTHEHRRQTERYHALLNERRCTGRPAA